MLVYLPTERETVMVGTKACVLVDSESRRIDTTRSRFMMKQFVRTTPDFLLILPVIDFTLSNPFKPVLSNKTDDYTLRTTQHDMQAVCHCRAFLCDHALLWVCDC